MLKTRILTALVGAPLMLLFIYLGGYWYAFLILVIALSGLKEFYALIKRAGWKPLEPAGYLFIPLLLFAVYRQNGPLLLSLWVFFFTVFSLFPVFFQANNRYFESTIVFWGIIYTGGLAGFLLALRLLPDGYLLSVFFIILIWTVDVLAYLVGSLLGKRPLAPKISPKKTIEGTLGGVFGSMVAGVIMSWFFALPYLNFMTGALMGLAVGILGVLGDLSQSALKRSVDAKDSGDFLPGHGGILDRFDGLLFAAPFFYIYVFYFCM